MSLKLIGLNDRNEQFEVEYFDHENVMDGIQRLFKKALGKSVATPQWECGVPNQDKTVVWKASTNSDARTYYLHVAFSDGRTW